MKRLLEFLVVALLALPMIVRGAANEQIYVTIVPTNGTANGDMITINGNVRYWSNAVMSATVIPATNDVGYVSTNLYTQIATYRVTNLTASVALSRLTNGIRLTAVPGDPLVVTASAGWATVSTFTNANATNSFILTLPLSIYDADIRSNQASRLVDALQWASNYVAEAWPAFGRFLNWSSAQSATNKTFYSTTNIGGMDTNRISKGGTLQDATRFKAVYIQEGDYFELRGSSTTNYLIVDEDGTLLFGGGTSAIPFITNSTPFGNEILSYSSLRNLFPNFSGPRTNAWSSTNIISGGLWIFYPNTLIATAAVLRIPTFYGGTNLGAPFQSYSNDASTLQLGYQAAAVTGGSIALGDSALASGDNSVALGVTAQATGDGSVAVGSGALSTAEFSLALGGYSVSSNANSAAIMGFTTADDQIRLGTNHTVSIPGKLVAGSSSNSVFTGNSVNNSDWSDTPQAVSSLANGNNVAVAANSVYMRLTGSPTAAFAICGLTGGRDGRILELENLTGQTLTLAHESGVDPAATNRIQSPTAADTTIPDKGWAFLRYDLSAARWKIRATNPAQATSTNGTVAVQTNGIPVVTSGTINYVGGTNVVIEAEDDGGTALVTINAAVTGGSGTPGGSSGQVQFNDGGSFGGLTNLTKVADVLTFVGGHIFTNGWIYVRTLQTNSQTLYLPGGLSLSGSVVSNATFIKAIGGLYQTLAATNYVQIIGSASPSITTAGQIGFDTDGWAASHGAFLGHDGTSNTFFVTVLATDTPSDGQVPKYNAASGMFTMEDATGSGTPGGSSGQVQINNGGSFDGMTNLFKVGEVLTFAYGHIFTNGFLWVRSLQTNSQTLYVPGGISLSGSVLSNATLIKAVGGLYNTLASTNYIQILGSASPSITTAGQIGFDTDGWAASHGAFVTHDGTSNMFLVSVLATDTPSDGQIPKYNAASGVFTMEDGNDSGGLPDGGSITNATVHGPLTLNTDAYLRAQLTPMANGTVRTNEGIAQMATIYTDATPTNITVSLTDTNAQTYTVALNGSNQLFYVNGNPYPTRGDGKLTLLYFDRLGGSTNVNTDYPSSAIVHDGISDPNGTGGMTFSNAPTINIPRLLSGTNSGNFGISGDLHADGDVSADVITANTLMVTTVNGLAVNATNSAQIGIASVNSNRVGRLILTNQFLSVAQNKSGSTLSNTFDLALSIKKTYTNALATNQTIGFINIADDAKFRVAFYGCKAIASNYTVKFYAPAGNNIYYLGSVLTNGTYDFIVPSNRVVWASGNVDRGTNVFIGWTTNQATYLP